MKMRVADYITSALYDAGGEHVFVITGGMIMHLTDALLQHGKQKFTCCHHEQAATMAADAYGRYTQKLGVAYVTAGPGALNTITGVVGAYVDSSPCIIVAGQSKVSQAKVTGPRQFSLQGYENLPIFEKFTKYAVMLDDISRVRYEVEKSIYIAKQNRVGPVYIECPIDIQAMYFDPDEYEGFQPPVENNMPAISAEQVNKVKELLQKSKRPCIIAGAGIRMANAIQPFYRFVEHLQIPVVTSRLGMDLLGFEHPLFVGHPGLYGDRPANFAVHNADLLLILGSRMGIGTAGYDFQDVAPKAVKICVDIDEKELVKPGIPLDMPIHGDVNAFLEMLLPITTDLSLETDNWVAKVQEWKVAYPVDLPEYQNEVDGVNSYHLTRVFSEKMRDDDIFILDTGSCFHVFAQAFKVKYGQRHIITGGLSTMGYMPGAIGVAAASGSKEVYCITGDGSLQMNIQELQTIAHNRLPVKIVVFNNNGYLLIRQTQKNFQDGRLIGEGPESGVGFPDLRKIADAYGIGYLSIHSLANLESGIQELIDYHGPVICEVMTPSNQLLIPRIASKKLEDGTMVSLPYDDMFPFLPRDEYNRHCLRNNCNLE